MSASGKKLLVYLVLLYLVIATVNAKAVAKNEAGQTNYFKNLLNLLNNIENVPIIGSVLRPYVSQIYSTVKEIDKWSDGSLSRLVNSVFPCELSGTVLTCSGTLDRNSLHKFILKIISTLPVGNSMLPMLEYATQIIV